MRYRLAAVLIGIAAALAYAVPASADVYPWRWAEAAVCVDDTTTGDWPLAEAVARVDAAVGVVSLVFEPGCAGHDQAVTVVDGDWPDWRATAQTKYVCETGPDCDPATDRRIEHAWIYLNAHYLLRYEPAEQLTILQHELLHALGVAHTDHAESLMGAPKTALRYTEPTAYDVADVRSSYRRAIDYRPAWRFVP